MSIVNKIGKRSFFGFEFFQGIKRLIFDSPISQFLRQFIGHLIELNRQLILTDMFMLNSNIKICQHSHMLNLSLFLLFNLSAKFLPIPLDIIQASLDGLDGLLV